MSIHILPVNRAVSLDIAETQALFYARMEADGMRDSDIWRRCVEQLAKSANAAIANEARRLMGGAS